LIQKPFIFNPVHSFSNSQAVKMRERSRFFISRAILFTISLVLVSLLGAGQTKYVKKYRPLADSLEKEFGIPAEVILGVAIIESSSGTSRNCKLLNNHFGVIGKNGVLKTKNIHTRYKQYPNSRASYIDFCKVLAKKKFYKKLKGNLNYHLWLDAISKSGYSEVPSIWKQRITATIQHNKLT
jgi:Bax protein